MSDYKIGLLILATSKNRDNWISIKDSYLFNLTLKTFLLTMNKEYEYHRNTLYQHSAIRAIYNISRFET